MRPMTQEEMEHLIHQTEWGTICVTEPDGTPYAIEATPFRLGEDICFMINPRGGVYRCIQANPKVLIKFTISEPGLGQWAGVSCHGHGEFDPAPDALRLGWKELGKIMDMDYSKAASVFNNPTRSPLFRVNVGSVTGRCSATREEPCRLVVAPADTDEK